MTARLDSRQPIACLIGLVVLLAVAPARADDYPSRGTCDKHLAVFCGFAIVRTGYIAVPNAEVDGSVYVALEQTLGFDAWDVGVSIAGMVGVGRNGHELQGAMLEIGTRRFFRPDGFMPYLGAGISPRLFIRDGAKLGFAPYAALGAMIGPQKTKLMLEGRFTQNVVPFHFASGSVYPSEVGAFIGLAW